MGTTVDEHKLEALLGTMVNELGAMANGALVVTGDRLGLYRALAADGPMTAEELADATSTAPRYVQEWLAAQSASGFIEYDGATERFSMTPEQIMVFADDNSPVLMTGGFYSATALVKGEAALAEAFRTGEGIGWGNHDACLFCGTAKFFRPGYKAHLVQDWLPALEGVVGKLEAGAAVADVGCGYGLSTLIMAEAFPKSRFTGYDFHVPSIEEARALAAERGLKNVVFEEYAAKDYPGTDFDLVTFFDCLHDMGDPRGAAAHVRQSLKPDGTWLLVEPFAHDRLEDNLNPVGRVYYSYSTAICTPAALSQDAGEALGAQAGEARLREVCMSGGFTRFRRATETPFNLILEARP